jgi:aryl-alcohol dehydrogenase-like predicted oxidoreductase
MAAFAQAHNMPLLPYGVVAGGFLSSKYLGLSARDVDVNTYSKGKYASVLGQTGGWEWLQRLLKVSQGPAY